MKKLQYLLAPIILGASLYIGASAFWNWLYPTVTAITVPVTFTDGGVLTASQLNSNNTTVYNAFNGHDHDGGDGEPSTLSFTAVDSAAVAFTAAVNGPGSSELLLDQDNQNVIIGDGTGASEKLTIISDSGDANLELRVNNATANEWEMRNDNSDSDKLIFRYNAVTAVEMETDGDLMVSDDIVATGGIAADGKTGNNLIAWEVYSGTTPTLGSSTTIDANTPGSGAPLAMSCTVNYTSDQWTECNGYGEDTDGAHECCWVAYDTSLDDTTITIFNNANCTNWASTGYKCIIIYTE